MGKRQNTKKPRIVDHQINDSDDESIPDDEAFNSEDERKYGSFFEKTHDDESSSEDEEESDGDSGSEEDHDEGSDEGDGGQYMLDLLDKLDDNKNNKKDSSKSASLAGHIKESEFASSVVPQAGLTLDSLLDGLDDTQGFGSVQKTMRQVAQGQATAAPMPKVVSDRAQRKVQYEYQSKDVSAWLPAVQENRQAETLDFRPKERLEVTRDVMVETFAPTTDFEKQIHEALQEAGQQDEQAMLQAEEAALQDDLGTNEISMEEYKKRRGQLAKMRALMFYQEQKRHHINKIKSKKYRRIRKKQKARQLEAETDAQLEQDPNLAKELQEKEEVERMKERMTLAHKNTSKWAKRVLKRGKNVDKDTRKALSAQIKRGDDLLQRMKSTRQGNDSDNDDSDEDLVETARKVLADVGDDAETPIQGKGLFKLSFMQKGIDRQREKAKKEARQLLMELEANEKDDDEHAFDDGDDIDEELKRKAKKPKVASKEEMKQVLNEGELVASIGRSHTVAVKGGIDIDLGFAAGETTSSNEKKRGGDSVAEHTSTMAISTASNKAKETDKVEPSPSTQSNKKKFPSTTTASTQVTNDEANPWMAATDVSETTTASKEKAKRKPSRVSKSGVVDVMGAVDLLDPQASVEALSKTVSSTGKADDVDGDSTEKKITMLTQEELVRKAFATSSNKEIDEEFAKEKAAIEEQEEDPTRKKKKEKAMDTVSGWGSWTGKGAPPPKPSRKLPKRLQPPEKKLAKRKREDVKKPHVIISEKRVKKTAQYMMAEVPYPFTSREEYEQAMAGGVGREWNVTSSFKDMTRPEVMTRPGKMIQPLSKRVKQPRPAAKF